mgnify:CR=1 FL=1
MSIQVKICGLRTAEALDTAIDAGADYFGLVFFERSPRNVDIPTARDLAGRGRGRARSVALLVDPGDGMLSDVLDDVNPDIVQLHGSETPERVQEIRRAAGRPVIKAIRVASEQDARQSIAYDGIADMVLFDAMPPVQDDTALPGGNGVPFDWQALKDMSREKRGFILSGGLTCDNVQDAIAATGAKFVDVSSGVESAPGEKDNHLIRRFIAAARAVR